MRFSTFRAGWLALSLAFLGTSANADVPIMTAEGGVTFTGVADPAEIENFGGHLLLYQAGTGGVVISSSVDGNNWTSVGNIADVQTLGVDVRNEGSLYRMVQTVFDGTSHSIRLRESSDGITWTLEGNFQIDEGGVAANIQDAALGLSGDGDYRIFIIGGGDASDPDTWNIGFFDVFDNPVGLLATPPQLLFTGKGWRRMASEPLPDNEVRLYGLSIGDDSTEGDGIVAVRMPAPLVQGLTFTDVPTVFLPIEEGMIAVTGSDTTPFAIGRATESFRKRIIYESTTTGTDFAFIETSPLLASASPNEVSNNTVRAVVTLHGEVFGPGIAAQVEKNGVPLAADVTYNSDTRITIAFDARQLATGTQDVRVTNADGVTTIAGGIINVTVAPGRLNLTDNLLRPLAGMNTQIEVFHFEGGVVTVRVYDRAGGLVRTLQDGDLPPGRNLYFWDGKNSEGRTVASGLYFVNASGPGLNWTSKIVVIK